MEGLTAGAELSAADVVRLLDLAPLPGEGGYFRETHRAPLAYGVRGVERSASTAIYYLLTADTYSAWHRLRSDEIYHFYAGAGVELFTIDGAGTLFRTVLGPRFWAGQTPQLRVPADYWQASRLLLGGAWALLGTTVVPGFDFLDCDLARPADVPPEYADLLPRPA